VHIENDAVLCGLGEAHFGAGITDGVMVYYTVSTGVNGVRIVDGVVDHSVGRYEMGYQIVGSGGAKPKSLEDLVGGRAFEERVGVSPREVRDRSIWAELEKQLARGLYNTTLYWNPQQIVLGGSMMNDLSIEGLKAALEEFPQIQETWPKLVRSRLKDEGGIMGAAAWAKQLGYR
jgi:predicted NBD/HSP70 family sugar kinase